MLRKILEKDRKTSMDALKALTIGTANIVRIQISLFNPLIVEL
jgi:hypothetical protein